METTAGRELTPDDLDALVGLATRCLAADGGLPAAGAAGFLRSRFTGADVWSRGVAGPDGGLVAAVAVRPQANSEVRLLGLVDPAHRGRGLGSALLDRGLVEADRRGGEVLVESEWLTEPAADLFATRGLARVFAEDVLRFDLAGPPPRAALPAGLRLLEWSSATADRFFRVYAAAFADRPGFPGWTAEEWLDWTAGDDDFRPTESLLATGPDGDVGFLTAAEDWISQVGVPPAYRGRGIGAALVAEALRRMRELGGVEALLTVNLNNAAGDLYRRLGFAAVGRRARYARPTRG
ncbi:GNAT family N-acetyltransferase [Plantactinospora siamensis]|uniref:GNAT family N-acetyltransferase n=1 Tax=Plantactinospora siamensis TaxID=555372 RepID=A0ABV6NZA0_9ACTN